MTNKPEAPKKSFAERMREKHKLETNEGATPKYKKLWEHVHANPNFEDKK